MGEAEEARGALAGAKQAPLQVLVETGRMFGNAPPEAGDSEGDEGRDGGE